MGNQKEKSKLNHSIFNEPSVQTSSLRINVVPHYEDDPARLVLVLNVVAREVLYQLLGEGPYLLVPRHVVYREPVP